MASTALKYLAKGHTKIERNCRSVLHVDIALSLLPKHALMLPGPDELDTPAPKRDLREHAETSGVIRQHLCRHAWRRCAQCAKLGKDRENCLYVI